MSVCFFLPGLLGSELGTGPGGILPLWAFYPRLVLGQVGSLRLAPNGSDPGAPDGELCTARKPLQDYYATAMTVLAQQLAGDGIGVMPWAYDWRFRAEGTGARLAQAIRQYSTPLDPCSVVAHSFGGLVARVAWANLVSTGDTALCRRIITLGSPHWGSYGAVSAWSGGSDSISNLSFLTAAAFVIQSAVTPLPFTRPWSYQDLVALSATWPAFYQTLPVLNSPTSPQDPLRVALFDVGNWPASVGISAPHLLQDRMDFQPFLRDVVLMPPQWVLTTVAGSGMPTYGALSMVEGLGTLGVLNESFDGDGVVTVDSALLEHSARFTTNARHTDLPLALALSGQLADMVRDVRSPPDPAPPAATIPAAVVPRLANPPIPVPFGPFRDC